MVLMGTIFFTVPAESRYYDPQIGRFLQRDPIAVQDMIEPISESVVRAPFNSQFINLYAFVGNNPINRIDPYGLYWGEEYVNWWNYESALPGPYGQPMSEWKCGSPTGWGDPMRYTEEAGGRVKIYEEVAVYGGLAISSAALGLGIAEYVGHVNTAPQAGNIIRIISKPSRWG